MLGRALILVLMLCAGCRALQTDEIRSEPPARDPVVAIVDGDPILASDVETRMRLWDYGALSQRDRSERRRTEVLGQLVLVKLEAHEAARVGLEVTSQEVDDAIDDVARRDGLSRAQLLAVAEGGGASGAVYREFVREQLVGGRLVVMFMGRAPHHGDEAEFGRAMKIRQQEYAARLWTRARVEILGDGPKAAPANTR